MDLKRVDRRSFFKFAAVAAIAAPGAALAAESSSFHNAQERALSFYNLHTGESLKSVYWVKGEYIPESLAGINKLMRDYRTGDVHDIHPRLLDLLCELRMRMDSSQHFELISGYRCPATNAMLHAESNGVAAHSLHMEGMAADVRLPQRSLADLRRAALSMKAGGVGYYPASQFVHVDVGRVRMW